VIKKGEKQIGGLHENLERGRRKKIGEEENLVQGWEELGSVKGNWRVNERRFWSLKNTCQKSARGIS